MRVPIINKGSTGAETQGKRAPPKFRPRSRVSEKVKKVRRPGQSKATRPRRREVGVWGMSRERDMRRKARPHMGRLM
jgi:hypothetical protein